MSPLEDRVRDLPGWRPVRVVLALSSDGDSRDEAPHPTEGGGPGLRRDERTCRVLVVDDDAPTRKLVARILRRGGLEVIEAEDAQDALNVVSTFPDAIDLLLTDVVMPGMWGTELAELVGRARPEARVICMSGYGYQSEIERAVKSGGFTFIEKPAPPKELLTLVHKVLGQPDE
jgi:DNA-binding NtrC family response regulator